MPTHAVGQREGDWALWLPAWLDVKERMAHCRWWDTTWLDLFSRVAKHDKHGTKPFFPITYPSSKHLHHTITSTLLCLSAIMGAGRYVIKQAMRPCSVGQQCWLTLIIHPALRFVKRIHVREAQVYLVPSDG